MNAKAAAAEKANTTEKDYVLGTHDEELQRLGLQHRVWQKTVMECWRNAGIAPGMRVADIGAGPGYATLDLAEMVGPKGHVLAIERSTRFATAARAACAQRGFSQVEVVEADLMQQPIAAENLDAIWCRWVACFVESPATLVKHMAAALCPGGVAMFHEYADYRSWRLAPRSVPLEAFVQEVMQSWRDNGGEPDIALDLPTLLAAEGMEIVSAVPRVFTVSPASDVWRWPASFIHINLDRLQEIGRISAEWAGEVKDALAKAQATPTSLMTTPLVLEIVARKA